MYCNVASTRLVNNGQIQKLQFAELNAWQQLKGIKLSLMEVQIISTIDEAVVSKTAEMRSHAQKLTVSRQQEQNVIELAKAKGIGVKNG